MQYRKFSMLFIFFRKPATLWRMLLYTTRKSSRKLL